MFAGGAPAVDPDKLFDRVYGLGRFLPLWLRYQAEAYRSATTMMRDFHEPEAMDLLGHVRRGALRGSSRDNGEGDRPAVRRPD